MEILAFAFSIRVNSLFFDKGSLHEEAFVKKEENFKKLKKKERRKCASAGAGRQEAVGEPPR